MRACIHRGAHEIGGSCVELEHQGQRVLLDLGRPLTARLDEDVPLPPMPGLEVDDPSLLGIVVSHGHPDHWGLVPSIGSGVPLYVGKATAQILREAAFFSPAGADLHATGYLDDRQPFELGPFTITPYLVDHSAFDAYALLVNAGGRRLFYSGDLRAHGRKARVFEELIAHPPQGIDALLLEGTTIQRRAGGQSPSESEVEERCVDLFGRAEGLVLACYSGQNIDRLVTLYRAARRSGRIFVHDLYTATIARASGLPKTIPQADWDGVRVFVSLSQRLKVKRSEEFDRINWVRGRPIFAEELAGRTGDLVLTFSRLDDARARTSGGDRRRARSLVHVGRLPRGAGGRAVTEVAPCSSNPT